MPTPDYRTALALTLTTLRNTTHTSIRDLSDTTDIPEHTLRSYEKATTHPTLPRLLAIATAYGTTPFTLLLTTAEYLTRAHGLPPIPHTTPDPTRQHLHALLLYCGLTPPEIPHYDP
ncbi:helix-turn-helix domain-containing protein [Actinokineospora pegani]|uniref:helix-turn-helix domain-containing protein n=1 Tax=Actinokineospora pegani TaxID=2654637 RepID=UPI0012EA3369|nr:helix-turn-helix transcriptional regulator [Actinokineospora pegani]